MAIAGRVHGALSQFLNVEGELSVDAPPLRECGAHKDLLSGAARLNGHASRSFPRPRRSQIFAAFCAAFQCSESPASQRLLPWCDRRTSTVLDSGSAESPARLTRRSPSAGLSFEPFYSIQYLQK